MSDIIQLFRETVGELAGRDTVDSSFRKLKIDESVIKNTQKHLTRHRCSQRIGKGLFFTDEEKSATQARMRATTLP